VAQLCEKVVIINRGHIVVDDALETLTKDMSLEQVFLTCITRTARKPRRRRH